MEDYCQEKLKQATLNSEINKISIKIILQAYENESILTN